MLKNYFDFRARAFLCASFFVSCGIHAATIDFDHLFPSKTVYFGVNIGGGSTTWAYLIDTIDQVSNGVTPIAVKELGPSWGVVFGFDVSANFAIELQYMQFADSHLTFDDAGKASYMLPSNTIISKTQAYSLSGKFYLPVGVDTHLRAFSAVGAGLVQRSDIINPHASCVTPYMSAGLSYNFTRHLIAESGFQYYTGFGASEVLPVQDFIPFAWDAYFRFAYQV